MPRQRVGFALGHSQSLRRLGHREQGTICCWPLRLRLAGPERGELGRHAQEPLVLGDSAASCAGCADQIKADKRLAGTALARLLRPRMRLLAVGCRASEMHLRLVRKSAESQLNRTRARLRGPVTEAGNVAWTER